MKHLAKSIEGAVNREMQGSTESVWSGAGLNAYQCFGSKLSSYSSSARWPVNC